MPYDRNSDNGRRGYYGRSETQDYGRDYAAHNGSYSSARDYAAAGSMNRDDRDRDYRSGGDFAGGGNLGREYDRDQERGRSGGGREQYDRSYGGHDYYGGDRDLGGDRSYGGDRNYGESRSNYGSDRSYGSGRGGSSDRDDDRGSFFGRDDDRAGRRYGGSYSSGRGGDTYGGESRRTQRDEFGFGSPRRPGDRQNYVGQHRGDRGGADYGRQPQGYDYEDRGFLSRAGDEVRSWFGDDDAERRREMDQRYDERYAREHGSAGDRYGDNRRGGSSRRESDDHYHSWRQGQIAALDRDYDEYRQENATKFHNEFSSFRTERQSQRDCLNRVNEHMEVTGSDGTHVGTVDKVRGDRILLTKNDKDAGGRHHSIPSRWIDKVDTKVTLRKSAEEAKSHWRDEERNSAFFGDEDRDTNRATQSGEGSATTGSAKAGSASTGTDADGGARNLNKSFSGTY